MQRIKSESGEITAKLIGEYGTIAGGEWADRVQAAILAPRLPAEPGYPFFRAGMNRSRITCT